MDILRDFITSLTLIFLYYNFKEHEDQEESTDGGANDLNEELAQEDEEEPEEPIEDDSGDENDESLWFGTENMKEKTMRIVEGNLDMEIPSQVKIVRIFTSSTFTGM